MNELNQEEHLAGSPTVGDGESDTINAANLQGAEEENPEAFVGWQRKIALFLSGQAISMFGSMLVQFAIIWHITLTTESGWMLALATAFGFLPQLVISIFAGVWADRYNRRYLVIGADIMIAAATLVLALLYSAGYQSIWLLFVVSGIRSIGAGIQQPAVGAMIPQIVPQESLMRVNGIFGTVQSLMQLLAPVVSAGLLTRMPMETVFYIDVVTALIAVAIMFMLQIPLHQKAMLPATTGYLDDLKEGLRYSRDEPIVRTILIFYSIFFVLIVPVAMLTPLMVQRTFGTEQWLSIFQDEYYMLMAMEIAFGAASAIGGIAIAVWGGFKNRLYTIALSCIAFGALTLAMGFTVNFFLFLVLMFLVGLFVPIFSTAVTTLLQERVPIDMLGRVFSLVGIVITGAFPFGMLVFGPMADIWGVEPLLIWTGVFQVVVGVILFRNRQLQNAAYAPVVPEGLGEPSASEAAAAGA